MKHHCCVLVLFVICLCCVALVLVRNLWLAGLGNGLTYTSSPVPSDAIVTLGGSKERISTAVALYKQDLAPELWYTGKLHTHWPDYYLTTLNSPDRAAIEMGVPAQAIHPLTHHQHLGGRPADFRLCAPAWCEEHSAGHQLVSRPAWRVCGPAPSGGFRHPAHLSVLLRMPPSAPITGGAMKKASSLW